MDFDLIPNTAPEAAANSAISVGDETLSLLAEKAFERLSFTFTETHLKHLLDAAADSRSSENDRFVCSFLLKNAMIAAGETASRYRNRNFAKDEGVLSTMILRRSRTGAKKTWRQKSEVHEPPAVHRETDPTSCRRSPCS